MIFLSGSYFAVFWCIIRPDGLVRGCGVGEARGRVSKKKEKQRKKQKKKIKQKRKQKGKKRKKRKLPELPAEKSSNVCIN